MSGFSFDLDLPDRVGEEIEQAIAKGIREGLKEIADEGRDRAQANIRANNLRHTGELITSFETESDGNSARIRNVSEHAAPQELGVSGTQRTRDTPLSYDDEKPPLEALIPWVQEHLTGMGFDPWNRYDGGGPGPSTASPGDDWQGLTGQEPVARDYEPLISTEDSGGDDGEASANTETVNQAKEDLKTFTEQLAIDAYGDLSNAFGEAYPDRDFTLEYSDFYSIYQSIHEDGLDSVDIQSAIDQTDRAMDEARDVNQKLGASVAGLDKLKKIRSELVDYRDGTDVVDENDPAGVLPSHFDAELIYRGEDGGYYYRDGDGEPYIAYETFEGWWSFSSAYNDIDEPAEVSDAQDQHLIRRETEAELLEAIERRFGLEEGHASRPTRSLPDGYRSVEDWEFSLPRHFQYHDKVIVEGDETDFIGEIKRINDSGVEMNLMDPRTRSLFAQETWVPGDGRKIIGREDRTLVNEVTEGQDVILNNINGDYDDPDYIFGEAVEVDAFRGTVTVNDYWNVNSDFPERYGEDEFYGVRENNEDLWADNVDVTTPIDSVPEDFTQGDPGITKNILSSPKDIEVIVNEDGSLYKTRVKEVNTYNEQAVLAADNPTIDGDEKEYTYDYENNVLIENTDTGNTNVSVEAVENQVHDFLNLEEGDFMFLDNRDPDEHDHLGRYDNVRGMPDEILRGRVNNFSTNGVPNFAHLYQRGTNFDADFSFAQFYSLRNRNDQMWTAKDLDKGDEVLVDGNTFYVTGEHGADKNYIVGPVKLVGEDGVTRNMDPEAIDEIVSRNGVRDYKPFTNDDYSVPGNYERDFLPDRDTLSEGEVVLAYDHRDGQYKELTVTRESSFSPKFSGEKPYEYRDSEYSRKQQVFPISVLGRRQEGSVEAEFTGAADIEDALRTEVSPYDEITINEWDEPAEVQSVFTSGDDLVVKVKTSDGRKSLSTNDGDPIVLESGWRVDSLRIVDSDSSEEPDEDDTEFQLDDTTDFTFQDATEEGDSEGAYWQDEDSGETVYLHNRDGEWKVTQLPAENTPETAPMYTLSQNQRHMYSSSSRDKALTWTKDYLNGVYDDPLPGENVISGPSGHDVVEVGDYIRISSTALNSHTAVEEGVVTEVSDSGYKFRYDSDEYRVLVAGDKARIRGPTIPGAETSVRGALLYKPQSDQEIIGADGESGRPFLARHLRDGYQPAAGFSSMSEAPAVGEMVYVDVSGKVVLLKVVSHETDDGRAALVLENEYGERDFYYPPSTGRESDSSAFVVAMKQ